MFLKFTSDFCFLAESSYVFLKNSYKKIVPSTIFRFLSNDLRDKYVSVLPLNPCCHHLEMKHLINFFPFSLSRFCVLCFSPSLSSLSLCLSLFFSLCICLTSLPERITLILFSLLFMP